MSQLTTFIYSTGIHERLNFTSNSGLVCHFCTLQGAKVLTHRHLEMLLEIWESNEISL